jgi:hypothetical protein
MVLKAGFHQVRVVNRFLGEKVISVDLSEGQTGAVSVDW